MVPRVIPIVTVVLMMQQILEYVKVTLELGGGWMNFEE